MGKGKQAVYFDLAIIAVTAVLFIGWAMEVWYIYVPCAVLLGACMVFWDRPWLRDWRAHSPAGEEEGYREKMTEKK